MTPTLHHPAPGVRVYVSEPWSTTCTAAEPAPGRVLVVDSPVLPGEPDAVRADLDAAGLVVTALAVTHADWDHLLAPAAFPGVPVLMARSTADRLAADRAGIEAEMAAWDRDGGRPRRPLPAPDDAWVVDPPATVVVDGVDVEVVAAGGHTRDGAAFLVPRLGLLCAGDYLSPVEEPLIGSGGSVAAYLATLDRLEAALSRVTVVVPGHGHPLPAAEAHGILLRHRRSLGG